MASVISGLVGGWVLAGGCRGLDSVPIIAGEHCASDREETVGCIRDGDTVELSACGGEAVRLLGVDAPEIAHDAQVEECFGPDAAVWMTERILREDVRLEFDAVCADVYERTLAYIWTVDQETGEETLVNEAIIRAGYARVYEEFDNIRLADRLYAAQADAQAMNAGLWAVCE